MNHSTTISSTMGYNFSNIQSRSFGEILRLIKEEKHFFTVRWAADASGVQTSTIYSWMSDNTSPNIKQFKALRNALINQKGCWILRDWYEYNDYDFETNGSYVDEMKDMIREMNEIDEHTSEGSRAKAVEDASQMIEIAKRYKAEAIEKLNNAER